MYSSGLGEEAAKASRESLSGAVSAAGSLPGSLADSLLQAARVAFANGVHTVAVMISAVFVGIALFTLIAFRRMPLIGQSETGSADLQIQDS